MCKTEDFENFRMENTNDNMWHTVKDDTLYENFLKNNFQGGEKNICLN